MYTTAVSPLVRRITFAFGLVVALGSSAFAADKLTPRETTPEATITAFVTAVNTGDIDGAAKYVDCTGMDSVIAKGQDELRQATINIDIESLKSNTFGKRGDVQIWGTVTIRNTSSTFSERVPMHLVGGRWLIQPIAGRFVSSNLAYQGSYVMQYAMRIASQHPTRYPHVKSHGHR